MTPVAWRKREILPPHQWRLACHDGHDPAWLRKLGWEPLYLRQRIPDDMLGRLIRQAGFRKTPKLVNLARTLEDTWTC